MALTLSPNESNALVYTLILKENGDTIVHAGKKTFINLPPEKLNNIKSLQKVWLKRPATTEDLRLLVGKDITSISFLKGVEMTENGTTSRENRALINNLRAFEVSFTGAYPAMTPAISAEILTLVGDASALLAVNNGTKMLDLTKAKVADPFYINDDCEIVKVNAADLVSQKVVLPFSLGELYINGDISKAPLDLSRFPQLKKIEKLESNSKIGFDTLQVALARIAAKRQADKIRDDR